MDQTNALNRIDKLNLTNCWRFFSIEHWFYESPFFGPKYFFLVPDWRYYPNFIQSVWGKIRTQKKIRSRRIRKKKSNKIQWVFVFNVREFVWKFLPVPNSHWDHPTKIHWIAFLVQNRSNWSRETNVSEENAVV